MLSGFILLSMNNPYLQRMPLWLTGTVIGRDVIIVSGSVLLYVVTGNVTVKPLFMSKTSAVLQMVTIGWVLFKLPMTGTLWLAVAVSITTGITGLLYVSDGIRQFSEHPAAQPKSDSTGDSET